MNKRKTNDQQQISSSMAWNPKDDIFKEFAMTPDNELLLWESWVKIRNDEVKKLGKRLNIPPVDLVMNQLEKVRADKEHKTILEYAQLVEMPRVRGHLWQLAPRLYQRCWCVPVYEIVRTRAELGHSKIIHHIGCPNFIQQVEKGLIGEPERPICAKLNADYEKYREKREETLKERIQKIDPYKSQIAELVVVGKRPKTPPLKVPPLPLIQVTEATDDDGCDALSGIYALRINNSVFIKEIPNQTLPHLSNLQSEPWHENCKSWTYYFNVPENKMGRSEVYLENLGTVSLRFCWKKRKVTIPFISEGPFQQRFFFCKNEDVLVPGQNKRIYFTFLSDQAIIYSECWELSILNICLFDSSAEKFIFNLVGDSIENIKKITKKIEKLEKRIDLKALKKFIVEMLEEIIITACLERHQKYPYKKMLLEAEMFIIKNPLCYYHQTEVQTLKEMYVKMTGQEWDLSIGSWRQALITKEFDERMSLFETLKTSHRILLMPWHEEKNLDREKFQAVYLLLGELADKFYLERKRISEGNGVIINDEENDVPEPVSAIQEGPLSLDIIQNIFYIRIYEHFIDTIEMCAGILSSLDLNRWIDFDFCQY